MMSQPVNNTDVESTGKDTDFGKHLAEARKAQNYSVEEISEHIKIPVHTINILESSDLDKLPAPTFAQGYIRAYAKFLEISEEDVLEKYSLAVPRTEEGTLKPRCNLPDEASSQSPLVKSITMLLIIAFFATLLSVIGDLFISVLKRERGVKDSGSILPGHGGVLDRIDSITSSAPFFVIFLDLLVFNV